MKHAEENDYYKNVTYIDAHTCIYDYHYWYKPFLASGWPKWIFDHFKILYVLISRANLKLKMLKGSQC